VFPRQKSIDEVTVTLSPEQDTSSFFCIPCKRIDNSTKNTKTKTHIVDKTGEIHLSTDRTESCLPFEFANIFDVSSPPTVFSIRPNYNQEFGFLHKPIFPCDDSTRSLLNGEICWYSEGVGYDKANKMLKHTFGVVVDSYHMGFNAGRVGQDDAVESMDHSPCPQIPTKKALSYMKTAMEDAAKTNPPFAPGNEHMGISDGNLDGCEYFFNSIISLF
jgi:hypothetical protein